mmetsp:Transcript_98020/g.224792  ORF Transcript_98020/g.224792 Transcript_98020/m.224792 type:complete len:460 (+) Transcript_98020:843-2222(+)
MKDEMKKALMEASEGGHILHLNFGPHAVNLKDLFCDEESFPAELFSPSDWAVKFVEFAGAEHTLVDGFQVVITALLSKQCVDEKFTSLIPDFENFCLILLDPQLEESAEVIGTGRRAALQFSRSCVPEQEGDDAEAGSVARGSPSAAARALREKEAALKLRKYGGAHEGDAFCGSFEFKEEWGEFWDLRWKRGPCETDDKGKAINKALINVKTCKYPIGKDAQHCLELMGGSNYTHCTGLYLNFDPVIRPTEVEFCYTVQGKADMSNAYITFTGKRWQGNLPGSVAGITCCTYQKGGGVVLSAGSGQLVSLGNAPKYDKLIKCRLSIDWNRKIVIGTTDKDGKGYPAARQTTPFRDDQCEGFATLYIYNTEVQATAWYNWIRIVQDENAAVIDTKAMDARAELQRNIDKREYDKAVASDMAHGMKMGAISATTHGPDGEQNLAEAQAMSFASAAGAQGL